ncbi:Preprotein translocase subunit SecE [Candidatus Phytoplasma pruni]|uniref:Preprotein translocase subunit SecE n=1 Tax=Candidatus Phytoplasma pruni TaxID=479893 RepID=A0A0M1N0F2_9MOLU|nr:hypothetical protein [Candidatus Phytoplasma pruni]KOR75643.1 Preprotein translocase subunit SecE [Candidatus Phytoplasma pruni]MCQ9618624.1 hypothetical protein [Candidatus Phytoplasma pruni]MDW3617850.1 hypothetical protein [Candidatus Phytoplasma pruni]
MSYKNKEAKHANPLFKIIKQEYGLINVFLIVLTMVFMGVFGDFIKQDQEKSLYKVLFGAALAVFLLSVVVLMKNTMKGMKTVSLPTGKQIFFQIIQVLIFILILVTMNTNFETLYKDYISKCSGYFQNK